MMHDVTIIQDRLYQVTLDYHDEGIDLIVKRRVSGEESDALHYVRAFDRDTRINYRHLFPIPEPEPHEGEEL
mgnify:CR=1 FL=1